MYLDLQIKTYCLKNDLLFCYLFGLKLDGFEDYYIIMRTF